MDHFLPVDNIPLFYREENPDAPATLFFLHGNSSSHHSWDTVIKDDALKDYRIIAFDLPAHGRSGALHIPYSLEHIGSIIAKAVLALAAGKPYILAGVSIGTNMIAEMLNNAAIAPAGIALIGPCIVGGSIKIDSIAFPDTKIGVCFTDAPAEAEITGLFQQAVFSLNETLLQALVADFKEVKDSFRSKMSIAIANGQYSNEIELFNKKAVPLLIIFGAQDELIDPDYLDNTPLPLWNHTIYKIQNAGHLTQLDAPAPISALLNEYISGRLTGTPS